MEDNPLLAITEALERSCGAKLPVPSTQKTYLSWGFNYPSNTFDAQPVVALESSVLWEREREQLGFTNLVEEINFQPWDGMQEYFGGLNHTVQPFVAEYVPKAGLHGHLTPFWLGEHRDKRLVPAYFGTIAYNGERKEVQREFLDHLECSSIMLLLLRPIFGRIAEGDLPDRQTAIQLLTQELGTHRFFMEEQKRAEQSADSDDGDEDGGDEEDTPAAPVLQ